MPSIANNFLEFSRDNCLAVVLNTEGLYFMLYDEKFRNIVKDADLIFIDGIGLKIALSFQGFKGVNRLHGPDFFHHMIHLKDNIPRLILGGSPKAHSLLMARYPEFKKSNNLVFSSMLVDVNDLSNLFELIEQSNPSEVYICLGIRKQEEVGSLLRKKYPKLKCVGVGASIDFESGNVKRSPKFMQKMGLEWLPRMISEPRMIPRNIRGIIGFSLFIFGKYIGHKNKFDAYNIYSKKS